MKLSKRHSIRLLCLFLCLFLSIFLCTQATWAQPCSINYSKSQEKIGFRWIYDGDTIQLSDGRKLRLIGIDTPELGKKGKKSQPYARKAKQTLTALLAAKEHLYLVYDKVSKDKYGRLLAYAFLDDGTDIQAELIREGLAVSIAIGVNDTNLACYRKLEHNARLNNKGIWSTKNYKYQWASNKKTHSDYAFFRGKVTALRNRGKYWKMSLNDSLEVFVSKAIVTQLEFDFSSIRDKTVKVRGPLKRRKKRNQVWVYHAANLHLY